MVPQQSHDGSAVNSQSDIAIKQEEIDLEHSTVFGSQSVKEHSNTPYTDATQVSTQTN